MPLLVGPLDNRRQLLADSRRNRWYDEKPGGSWTVPGGSRGGREEKGERREKRERGKSREESARAGGILRRREAQNLLHVATNSCSNL